MKTVKKLILFIIIMSTVSYMFTYCVSAEGPLAYGAATVGAQGLRMRIGPNSSNKILDTLVEGDIVIVLERTNDEWYKINFHGRVGYVSVSLLRDILTEESFYEQGYTIGEMVNLRADPDASGKILGSYGKYTEMSVIGIKNGWYKVRHNGQLGYIRSDLMRIKSVHTASAGSKAKTPAGFTEKRIATNPTINPDSELGPQIAEYAQTFVGMPYIYGSTGPSAFDCSGLVYFIYRKFGYTVSRTAGAQNRDANGEVFINRAELYPGDLVFFSKYQNETITHIGIFIGNDEFVHASREGVGIIISNLESTYYKKVWHSGKRLYSPET
jgi:cell wall-associated NlpC family hydrolase